MPGYDGTGPQGSGKPGREFGPCGRNNNSAQFMGGMHRNAQHPWRRRFCQTSNANQNFIYDYSAEELINRKNALEKEIQWLEERIKEIDKND